MKNKKNEINEEGVEIWVEGNMIGSFWV